MPGILFGDPIEVLEESAIGGLDDIRLGDAGDPCPAVFPGVLEGQSADAIRAGGADQPEIDGDVGVDLDPVGAEGVEVLRVLTEEDPVDALLGDPDRPDVGEEVELLPHGHVAAFDIGPGISLPGRRRRAFQGDVVFLDLGQDVVGDGLVVGGPVLDRQALDVPDRRSCRP